MRMYEKSGLSLAVVASIVFAAFAVWIVNAPAARGITYFSDNFDSGMGSWIVTGAWHAADQTVDPCYGNAIANHPAAPASPPVSAAFHFDASPPALPGLACTYALDDGSGNPIPHAGNLQSVPIDLTGVSGPLWLHFSTWRQTEDNPVYDTMWVNAVSLGPPIPLFQLFDPSFLQMNWETFHVDVSVLAGLSVSLQFSFNTVDGKGNAFAGWYVDNVLLDDVAPASDRVDVSASDSAPAGASVGDTNVLMATLGTRVNANFVTLERVRIDLTGTGADTDISAATLWADDGDGMFSSMFDFFLDSKIFTAGTLVFGTSWMIFAGVGQQFFITYDISIAATVGAFVGVGIVSTLYFSVAPPDTVSCASCPFDTYRPSTKTEILPASVDNVTVAPGDMSPTNVRQGDRYISMAYLDATVDANTATLETVRVDLTGTGADSDITSVGLWQDDGDLVFDRMMDMFLTSSVFVTQTTTLVAFLPLSAGQTERLFIVYDIASTATVGAFVGAGIADPSYFTVTAPDAVACSGCPWDTYVPGTKTEILAATADTLTFQPFDLAPLSVEQGQSFVLMGGMDLTVDTNSVTVGSVRLDLSGTGSDADISWVVMWQDDGDGNFDMMMDTILAFGMFATGRVDLFPFTSFDVSAGAPQTAWFTFDIATTATIGAFVGISVADSTYVSVPSPDVAACTGCPFDTHDPGLKTEIVPPPTDTLTVVPVDLAPNSASQGEPMVLMGALDASVDANDATLETIEVDLTGTGADADIAQVGIWLDDGDLAFDPGFTGDFELGSDVFIGGTVTLNVYWPVDAASPQRFFVTYDIAASATVGAFVGMEITDAAHFSVSPPDGVVCTGCPFDTYVPSGKTEILAATPDLVTFTPFDAAPNTVQPGDSLILMGGVDYAVDANVAWVDSVTLDLTGTGPDSDIGGIAVWRDNGDGTFGFLVDELLGFGTFFGGTATVSLMAPLEIAAPATEKMWITFDISIGATVGDFVGFGMADSSYVSVMTPDTATCSGCPFTTYVAGTKTEIVTATTDTVSFTPVDYAPGTVRQSDTDVAMMALDISVDANTATLQGIVLHLTGQPPLDSDVVGVTLWLDDGDQVLDPGDLRGPSQPFSGGIATFSLGLPISASTPLRLWFTYDISATAAIGDFVGIGIGIADLSVLPPDSYACVGCPFDTYEPGTKTEIVPPTPDTLSITLADLAPTTTLPGTANVSMIRMGLAASPGPVTLNRIDVLRSGTGTDADIAAVSVWQDDGDSTFNPAADTELVSGAFSSGLASLTLGLTVPGGSSTTLFLVYDVAAGAVLGNYVGARLPLTSFVVGGGDQVSCASCPFDTYVAGTKTRIVGLSGTIDGTVLDQDNNLLAGVVVELVQSSSVVDTNITDSAGGFLFTAVIPDTYTVRASLTGYQGDSEVVTLPAGGSQTVTLQLVEIRGSVTGRVRDEATQTFILAASVQLYNATGGLVDTEITDTNGRFTFGDLDFGTYSIRVTAAGYQTESVPDIDVLLANPDVDVGIIDLTKVTAQPFPVLPVVGALIAIIVVVLLLVLLMMRRKKRGQEQVAAPPGQPPAQMPLPVAAPPPPPQAPPTPPPQPPAQPGTPPPPPSDEPPKP